MSGLTYVTLFEWFLELACLLPFLWLMLPPILIFLCSRLTNTTTGRVPAASLHYSAVFNWRQQISAPLLTGGSPPALPSSSLLPRHIRGKQASHCCSLIEMGVIWWCHPQLHWLESHSHHKTRYLKSWDKCIAYVAQGFGEIWLDQFVTPLIGTLEHCSFECNS